AAMWTSGTWTHPEHGGAKRAPPSTRTADSLETRGESHDSLLDTSRTSHRRNDRHDSDTDGSQARGRDGREPRRTSKNTSTSEDGGQRRHHPPVQGPLLGRGARRLEAPHRGDAVAGQGDRVGSVAGRAARDDAEARALLGERLRLAQVRGEAERPAELRH